MTEHLLCCFPLFKCCEILLEEFAVVGFVYNTIEETSSANGLQSDVLSVSGRSFMYAKNNSGPSTVPWGTPERTSDWSEWDSSSMTSCFRFSRKARIQVLVWFRIPVFFLTNTWRYVLYILSCLKKTKTFGKPKFISYTVS